MEEYIPDEYSSGHEHMAIDALKEAIKEGINISVTWHVDSPFIGGIKTKKVTFDANIENILNDDSCLINIMPASLKLGDLLNGSTDAFHTLGGHIPIFQYPDYSHGIMNISALSCIENSTRDSGRYKLMLVELKKRTVNNGSFEAKLVCEDTKAKEAKQKFLTSDVDVKINYPPFVLPVLQRKPTKSTTKSVIFRKYFNGMPIEFNGEVSVNMVSQIRYDGKKLNQTTKKELLESSKSNKSLNNLLHCLSANNKIISLDNISSRNLVSLSCEARDKIKQDLLSVVESDPGWEIVPVNPKGSHSKVSTGGSSRRRKSGSSRSNNKSHKRRTRRSRKNIKSKRKSRHSRKR
jgi:hypothetical protein